MKKNMDLWTDAWALAPQGVWQRRPEPSPPVPSIEPQRPAPIQRRETKRQATLARLPAQEPPPPPAEVRTHTEFCALAHFTSWTAATVPIQVVLLRDHYADGHHADWALMTTQEAAQPAELIGLYAKRPAIEERHRQLKCFYDLSRFRSRNFNAIAAQVVMVLLTYTLRQWQLWKFWEEALANLAPRSLAQQLNLRHQWVVIYLGYAYTEMPLITFTREVLQLAPPAQEKALKRIQILEQNLLTLPPNPRPA